MAHHGQGDSTAGAERGSATTVTSSVIDKIICAAALLLFVLAADRFFFGAAFALQLNSDAAVPVLLADEMLRKGSLFPSNWYYANGEIWVLSPQIFALPFVAALGASPLALKLANILALASMIGSLVLPIQRVSRSWPFSLTVALGVLAVFSRHHVNMVYEQAAYGWICAKLALLIFLSMCALADARAHSTLVQRLTSWYSILYLLVLVEFAIGSPLRAFVYWGVPITIACILPPSSWRGVRSAYLIALTFVALLIGSLVHLILSRYLQIVPGAGMLQPVMNWPLHLRMMWEGLPLLLQYEPVWAFSTLSLTSAATFVRCIFFAAAAGAIFFAWRRAPSECAESQFLLRLAAVMFVVVLGTLTVGDLVVHPVTLRYLLPQALICLVAFMTTIWCRLAAQPKTRATVAALFVVAFCGGAVLLAATFPSNEASDDCEAPVAICSLHEALQQHNLHKGYATYWNANVTTLASGGDIAVCGVALKPRLVPVRWLISRDCFETPRAADRYFIALARSQTTSADRQMFLADAGTPDSTASAGDYEIWIYEAGDHHTDWLQH